MSKTTTKPRVLVTYIESGYGHIVSAQAIAERLKDKYGGEIDVVETQIMRDDNDETLIKYEKFLTTQTQATSRLWKYGDFVFGVLNMGKRPFMKFMHRTFFRKAVESTVQAFVRRKPDVIISTHYFVTYCAMEYKKRSDGSVTVISYNPDNNVHVWWDSSSDVFITNNNLASTEAIRKRNYDYTNVKQVNFTVRNSIKEFALTKEQCRQLYGIPQDRFCIMIADSAYAGGKAKSYCKWIAKHTDKPLTVIFLAGKNRKMYEELREFAQTLPDNVLLMPFEFTEKVYELYACADLFVTKAGPNSILDCLFVGTPIMVDNCPHPIERATCKLFVDSYGCGVTAFNKYKANRLINGYITDPSSLETYRQNIVKNIDKTADGAAQIAEIVYSQIRNKGSANATYL
ncbi:MAG: hypothetical protein J1F65_05600 [Clostridiales bacterium]|nr:hypothetical protein [Clostridiales bacterium]